MKTVFSIYIQRYTKQAACAVMLVLAACSMLMPAGSRAAAIESSAAQNDDRVINFIINNDESTLIDRLLYHAMQRIGYSMTMDAMPMAYAIQMANSGERDALANQSMGLEQTYTNLVMVPEQIGATAFQVFVREGSGLAFNSWEDLSGYTIGHLYQKTYIINHLPEDIAGAIQRETFYDLNNALLAGECDAIVTTSTFDRKLIAAGGVEYSGTIDIAESFTFLNKKFEHLVMPLSDALAEMKADGTYDNIIKRQWNPQNYEPCVLHISSFYAEDIWDERIKDGILEGIGGNGEISYYNIPLYSNRFRSVYEQAQSAYYALRTMMMSNPPDIIVASDASAVVFVCNYYYTLFDETPVILYGLSDDIDHLWQLGDNYTAIWEDVPAAETASMVKKLLPETERLYVINDHTINGVAWRQEIESVLGSRYDGMDVTYSKNLPHTELLRELAMLPDNSAILLGHYTIDSDGLYIANPQVGPLIMNNTAAPVFSMRYGSIGYGQIGGKYIDPLKSGTAMGRFALEAVAGSALALPPDGGRMQSSRWIFDEAALASYGIDIGLVPAGAQLINHKGTLYEQNPQVFIMIVISGGLGILLIVSLSVFIAITRRQNKYLLETQKSLYTAEELKEAADQANRAKSTFLANMSHEIRTPLNAILGVTEIHLAKDTLKGEARDALEQIFESGDILLNIINDILDLSKIEAGKLEIMPVKYDIASLVNDVAQLNRLRYEEKPIEFTLNIDKDMPVYMYGDELRIKQILNNILSNAFKYTDTGEIEMTVHTEPAGVEKDEIDLVLEVSDTGQGMSEEQQEKMFEKYVRFNLDQNRTIAGTGLGLNVTALLVDLMDGEIHVQSRVGEGSTFTVRLPQKRVGTAKIGADLTERLKTHNYQRNIAARKVQFDREHMPYGRVLIVDDVASNLYVTRGILDPYGLQTETVMSGFAAIDRVKSGNEYDIIFMDHMMPKMDGMETTRILRESGYSKPIIALTANALVGNKEMFLSNGFDGYVSKPIDTRELNGVLNKFIRDRKQPGPENSNH